MTHVTIEFGNRLNAHLTSDYDPDVNQRVKCYDGTRWDGVKWLIPARWVQAGAPRHPLYLPSAAELAPWPQEVHRVG